MSRKTAILLVFILINYTTIGKTKDDAENYLRKFHTILENNMEKKKLSKIAADELNKFQESGDSLYFYSHKLTQLMYNFERSDRIRQFEIASELVLLNQNKYKYLSIIANYNMSSFLEVYSPILSLKHIAEARKAAELISEKKIFPHLLHQEGRIYFQNKNYDKALESFTKALQNYEPSNHLYRASMYNNFANVYTQQNKPISAMEAFKKGMDELNLAKNMNKEEANFLVLLKRNLAVLYFQTEKYNEAKEIWENLLNEYINKDDYLWDAIQIASDLFDLYDKTGDNVGIEKIYSLLKPLEKEKAKAANNKLFNETLFLYAAKKNNAADLKKYGKIVFDEKDKLLEENDKYQTKIGNILNKHILINARQKYEAEMKNQAEKLNWIYRFAAILVLAIIIGIIALIQRFKLMKSKRELEEQQKMVLVQNMQLQEEKIKIMHLNLNLKQETEKAFLNKLKKIRSENNQTSEKIVKDLYFEVNNLLGLDRKKFGLQKESTNEAQKFKQLLAKKFPELNETELNLCGYFKMNLRSKEIALLENLSEGSVRVYKSKIKTKLNIDKNQSLTEYLDTFTSENVS